MILGLKNMDANYAELGSFFIFDSHDRWAHGDSPTILGIKMDTDRNVK